MCITSGIHQKGILMYSKRFMGDQRKNSLMYAQINWEPGVEITPLKIFFSNRVTVGEPEC